MGLDISAYRKLVPAPEAELNRDGYPLDETNCVLISPALLTWTEHNFPGRTMGVKPGVFSFTECFAFGAGAYSVYGQWRDELTRFAFYEHRGVLSRERAAEYVWERDIQGPFVELINFADNEGIIGPVVAAKLAKDFTEHQERANAYARLAPRWCESYTNWRRAFEIAADAGAIRFH
jgi:hypothetical protein